MFEERPNPGFLVAVKSLHEQANGTDKQELLEEAAVMTQFDHPNVVKLIGAVTAGKPLWVVLEVGFGCARGGEGAGVEAGVCGGRPPTAVLCGGLWRCCSVLREGGF